jgi:hypothetical protein
MGKFKLRRYRRTFDVTRYTDASASDKHRHRFGQLSADKQQPPMLMADGGTVRWRPKGDRFTIATTEFISTTVNTIDDITPFRAARFDRGGGSFRNLRNFESLSGHIPRSSLRSSDLLPFYHQYPAACCGDFLLTARRLSRCKSNQPRIPVTHRTPKPLQR